MYDNSLTLKRLKFSVMFLLGVVMIIFPNSLISILLFILGLYVAILGFNALVSAVILLKYSKSWRYDGFKALILSIIGCLLLFNTGVIASALSGFIFIILGLIIFAIGIMAIAQTREYSAGIIFIVVGLLIALFPLGVSFFITRLIGVSLVFLSVSLLLSIKTRSS